MAIRVALVNMAHTLTSEIDAATQAKAFPSSGGEMFGEYFAPGKSWNFTKSSLLDARARRILENTALACSVDAYPFHMPLEAKAGPSVIADGHPMLMLSSYDYLGLIGDPRIDQAATEAIAHYGTSTSGARLLTGTLASHRKMEQSLADLKGTEDCLTFSSGYLANLGAIYGLFGPGDRVIIDEYCHRSLHDACRMTGVQVQRFRHNDPQSAREELQKPNTANRTLIISDGVFSMDGDICCLPDLVALKKEFGCFLLIDEAHATGVLGATGRGTDEHFGIATSEVDIWTGSLAKSIPSNGGFIAVSQEVAIFLQHASSPYIFSAAVPAASVAAIAKGVEILKSEPERVTRLRRNGDFLRAGLQKLGYDTGLSETAVIPVVLKDEARTALFARRLRDHGIIAAPVMFPAVSQGLARLRLCVTAAHTMDHLEFVLDVFRKMAAE
ncbi:8-amino-7-oxononanoate synthase [Granulicella tundricola MP5ACTX9]|uniref:8-amino-7-oxononanoate synthase n=2 Tax=Granulicella TaxID=940557 RepID=E8X5K7_GRATM|nr:8-amino-7-oxononanoate synthase [Granulicella tundricola MP5ACTX9]